jgi:TonB family protein
MMFSLALSGLLADTPSPGPSCAIPDRAPSVTRAEKPVYPASALDLGLGRVTVLVLVTVSPAGTASAAHITLSSHNMAIDYAALKAARESVYTPAVRNCEYVEGETTFEADFTP